MEAIPNPSPPAPAKDWKKKKKITKHNSVKLINIITELT